MGRKIHQGWRYFECTMCETKWRETCRDHETESNSRCPKCQTVESPITSEPDGAIPIDGYGNLLGQTKEEILE